MSLNELSGELVDHPRIGERRRAFDIHLLANLLEERICRIGMKLLVRRELLSGCALEFGTLILLLVDI